MLPRLTISFLDSHPQNDIILGGVQKSGWLYGTYAMCLYIIGNKLLLQLFAAVLLSNFSDTYKEMKMLSGQEQLDLKTTRSAMLNTFLEFLHVKKRRKTMSATTTAANSPSLPPAHPEPQQQQPASLDMIVVGVPQSTRGATKETKDSKTDGKEEKKEGQNENWDTKQARQQAVTVTSAHIAAMEDIQARFVFFRRQPSYFRRKTGLFGRIIPGLFGVRSNPAQPGTPKLGANVPECLQERSRAARRLEVIEKRKESDKPEDAPAYLQAHDEEEVHTSRVSVFIHSTPWRMFCAVFLTAASAVIAFDTQLDKTTQVVRDATDFTDRAVLVFFIVELLLNAWSYVASEGYKSAFSTFSLVFKVVVTASAGAGDGKREEASVD